MEESFVMRRPANSAVTRVLCARLDEVLTGVYLALLVGLGIWRGAPIFEDIRSSGLAWRALQFMGMGIFMSALFFRARLVGFLRDWLPFVLALMTYEGLKHMHATALTTALGIHPIDGFLSGMDESLFGGRASDIAGRIIGGNHFVLSALKLFYAGYYFLPGCVLGYLYFFADQAKFFLVRRAVVICLYGGYLMYVLLPAAGPEFDVARLGHAPAGVLHAYSYAMANLRYQFDCFPSLHTALPWALTMTSWPFLPKLMRAGLVTCAVGSTAAAVGLGFHYGTDLIGGFAWAAIVVWLTHWTTRKSSSLAGRRSESTTASIASGSNSDEVVPGTAVPRD